MHVLHILFNGIEVGNGSKEKEASLGERGLCIGYITRGRSLRDLHTGGLRPEGM